MAEFRVQRYGKKNATVYFGDEEVFSAHAPDGTAQKRCQKVADVLSATLNDALFVRGQFCVSSKAAEAPGGDDLRTLLTRLIEFLAKPYQEGGRGMADSADSELSKLLRELRAAPSERGDEYKELERLVWPMMQRIVDMYAYPYKFDATEFLNLLRTAATHGWIARAGLSSQEGK
jgi:hypothetical protein